MIGNSRMKIRSSMMISFTNVRSALKSVETILRSGLLSKSRFFLLSCLCWFVPSTKRKNMSMNGEIVAMIAQWVKLSERAVKLQAQADNLKTQLQSKGVSL